MTKIKIKRVLPSPKAIFGLLRPRKPILNSKKRRLARALTIYDLRKIAKRRTPKAPFDYTDGAADSESSLKNARATFENVQFVPRVLRDVSKVDLTVNLLGKKSALPFGIAPTGFTRMMQTEGEFAGCTAAMDSRIPFTLSTMGTRSIEEVANAAPTGRNFFQLYMWKDRDRSMGLVERADKAGFEALVLTVDVPVAGARLRDVRNGMTIPPSLTTKTILNAIPRPGWWMNFLTTEPLKFASLDTWDGTVAQLLDSMFDPTVTFADLKWIRKQWRRKLIVKGIQNAGDAALAFKAGADAIVLSNHGGRQLDRAPIPFKLIPEVRKKVGKNAELHVDTGIMHGQDIVACLAAGANFTWIGRAYLYGLMAGGKLGVDRTIEILQTQIIRTMKLLGVKSISELKSTHIL